MFNMATKTKSKSSLFELPQGSLRVGKPRTRKRLSIAPLFAEGDLPKGPEYLTLDQAMEKEFLEVSEVDEDAIVGIVHLTNRGRFPVLILEGEEIAGAKQNRSFNVSIFLAPGMEVEAPVSCTEQGRWGYREQRYQVTPDQEVPEHLLSDEKEHLRFMSPKRMMHGTMRSHKSASVSRHLKERHSYHSDQGEVWEDVEDCLEIVAASSGTSSLGDAYEARKEDLRETADSFPLRPGQIGYVVFLDGQPVGVDWVSQPAAYKKLHAKLIESQAMNAVASPKFGSKAKPTVKSALDFLSGTFAGERSERASVGLGRDLRHETEGSLAVLLEHEGVTLHAGVHRLDENRRSEHRETIHSLRLNIDNLRLGLARLETQMESLGELDPEEGEKNLRLREVRSLAESHRLDIARMETLLRQLEQGQFPV